MLGRLMRRNQQKRWRGRSQGCTEQSQETGAPGSPESRFQEEDVWVKGSRQDKDKENQESTIEFSNEDVTVTLARTVLMA